jgi:hypothetical protein
MVELILASGSLLAAAALLAAVLPPRGTLAFLVAMGVLADAMLLVTMGLAGVVLRALRPEVLLAIALAWLALAVGVARLSPSAKAPWPERARGPLRQVAGTAREPAVAIGAVLVIASLAWRAFLATRLPLVDYDGWSYHLVFGDVWLQRGALENVPQRIWTAGYPANSEVLTTWLMAFTRSDALAGLSSLLPAPLAMAGVAGLARAFGASRPWAALGGLLFGTTPALVALAGTSYVDASSVAFAVATWWLGLRVFGGDRARSTLLLLGIAGGIAIGTKGTNAPLMAPILTAAGLVLLRDLVRAPSRERVGVVGRLAALCLPVVAFGAIWYLKNWLVWGNPLYPFAIGPFAGPTTLATFGFETPELEGLSRIQQLALSWTWDWHIGRYAYNVRPGGLGRAWPLILPLAILGLGWLLRRRRWAPAALVILPAWATLATMPMPWYARYTLFVAGLGAALAAVGIGALPPRLARLTGLVLVGIAAISLAVADGRPNIDVRSPDGQHLASPTQYLAYVLDPSPARRADVSLRKACAGFSVIPPGSRVAPGGFNLLHGVVGPSLDRILTEPLPTTLRTADALAEAMLAQGASWLVTSTGSPLDAVAASGPARFLGHGTICEGGRLWQLVGA